MQHDNYDKDILKQLKRIADSLEKIEKKLPHMWPVGFKGAYSMSSEMVKGENNEQNDQN